MKLEDIDHSMKLLHSSNGHVSISHLNLFIAALPALVKIAKAAKILRENTDECGDSPFELRWALTEAIDELENL